MKINFRAMAAVLLTAAAMIFILQTPSSGQLQSSGGTGNITSIGGSAVSLGAKTSANSFPVVIASDQGALPASQSGTWNVTVNQPLPAGTNLLGSVYSVPKTACGNTVASQALAAVPTSSTAVFASTTCVVTVVLNNTTSGALTVSVSDGQGSPVSDVVTFSIPANSQMIQPLYGVQFTSGVKWSASGSGVTGAVLGYQ